MKLRNKKTGEIVKVESLDVDTPTEGIVDIPSFDRKGSYNSLAELNEEWCDYEEPKEIWTITTFGEVQGGSPEEDIIPVDPRLIDKLKEIGNYFDTREDAEKAVEKLKAWKRLKDKGFRFTGYTSKDRGTITEFEIYCDTGKPCIDRDEFTDLDICFGGEE